MSITRISPMKYMYQEGKSVYTILLTGEENKTISCNCFDFTHFRECNHADEVASLVGYNVRKKAKPKDPYYWLESYQANIAETLNNLRHDGRVLGSVTPLPRSMPKWK